MTRKEEGRGLVRIEDSVGTSTRRLKDYIKKEQRKTNYSHQEQREPQKDQRNNNSNEKTKKTWTCLKKGNFDRKTEYLLIAA